MSLERGVADAANVVAAIGEPVEALIGHSWGGAVAIVAGARLDVRRVAAIDPMIHQVSDRWYGEYLDELNEVFALQGDARDARTREDYAAWSPLDLEGKVHAVHSMTVAPIEGLWQENPPASWDLHPLIARYPKPLLLAMADLDDSINDEEALLEVVRDASSQVRFTRIAGAGHNVHRTHFEALTAVLDSWL